jgi:hypothetical protein
MRRVSSLPIAVFTAVWSPEALAAIQRSLQLDNTNAVAQAYRERYQLGMAQRKAECFTGQ